VLVKEKRKGRTITDVEERFRQIFSANGRHCFGLAASYARDPSDRDDLFQEIASLPHSDRPPLLALPPGNSGGYGG